MPSQTRVLMIVYGFVPDDPRVITEAHTLVQLGYEVDAIGAGFPNGCSGDYSQESLSIIVIPVVNKVSHIPQALSHLMRGKPPEKTVPVTPIPASNAISLTFYFLWILRLALFKSYDVIHAHEHQSMPVGWLLASIKRIKWIYDAHEHVPGNRHVIKTFKARMAIRTEAFFLRRAAAVITVGNRLKRSLEERGAQQVIIIGNWKQLGRFDVDPEAVAAKHREYGLGRFALIVAYFGVLNEERQVDVLLEAISGLPEVGLLIAGRSDLREATVAAAQQHDNIIWLDWLPYDEIALHTMLSDIIYACLKPMSGNPEYMAPNKLFDAFAAGKAMIARRGVGEIGEILEQEKAAILLDEVTPQTVRDGLLRLKDDPNLLRTLQANARQASVTYNWETAQERLATLYEELIAH